MAFSTVTYLLFSIASKPWILFLGVVTLSASMLAMPTIQAMLSKDAGEQRQGEVLGALSSLQGLMLVIGPLVMGALFSVATRPDQAFHFPGAPFLAAAIIAIVAFIALRGTNIPDDVAHAPASKDDSVTAESPVIP